MIMDSARSDELRARHVRRLHEHLPNAVARIDWRRDAVREHRVRSIRRLLRLAYDRSPWHRERLVCAGVDVDAATPEDLAALPPMTKSDLMENFDDIVTDRRLTLVRCEQHLERRDDYLFDEYGVVASGGSSGLRGVFVYGWDAWACCYASVIRFQERDWRSDPALRGVARVTAVVGAAASTHLSAALGRTFSTSSEVRRSFAVTQPLSAIVRGLNELQPTILMSYSSFLAHLVEESSVGRLQIAPRRVYGISEPLVPGVRAAAESAWGTPVASGYGMSEGLFAGACGHGLHLPDDLCLTDLVDSEGRPVQVGERANRIYLTNLYNDALPLVRYEVTDQLTQIGRTCACGSSFTRIADPLGRLEDEFVYGAVTVHPHVFSSVIGRYRGVREYQVVQSERGAAVAIAGDHAVDVDSLRSELCAALSALGIDAPEISVGRRDAIPRQSSGKLKRFVALERR